MSTMSIATGATIPARFAASAPARSAARHGVRTRLRLTRRGRRVLAGLAAAPLAAAIGFSVIGGGVALASRDGGTHATDFTTVTVMSGESLWSIAEAYAPGADPRDVVADIQRLNGLVSSEVQAGQSIAIPMEYASGE